MLKKARRICWTWARSSHFMWANSSSRLYWPSWSRAWSGPVVIALRDAQSGRLYWPNIGPILGLKVRFLLCLDLPRPGAETIFSFYRGEKFLRSGAENPPLDLPRPGAETIFSLYRGEKFSALGRGESTFGSTAPGFSAPGRGESTFGSTAPERGNEFLLYIGAKIILIFNTLNSLT